MISTRSLFPLTVLIFWVAALGAPERASASDCAAKPHVSDRAVCLAQSAKRSNVCGGVWLHDDKDIRAFCGESKKRGFSGGELAQYCRAFSRNEANDCSTIRNGHLRGQCLREVGGPALHCAPVSNGDDRALCRARALKSSGECAPIRDKNLRGYCGAVMEFHSGKCPSAPRDLRQKCQDEVNRAMRKCASIQDENKAHICRNGFRHAAKNCSPLRDDDERSLCFARVLKSPSDCASIRDSGLRNKCCAAAR